MMDLSSVKKLFIPEGEVKEISSGGKVLWKGGCKNRLPLATDTDLKTIYGGDYNGDGINDGYKTGTRISSSGNAVTAAGMCATGFIPVKNGDVVRMKNTLPCSGTAASYFLVYDSDLAKLNHWSISKKNSAVDWSEIAINNTAFATYLDGILSITVTEEQFGEGVAYFRLSVGTLSSDTVVTVNEEIT